MAEVWTKECQQHPLFHELAPLVNISLEKNSSAEQLRIFFAQSLKVFEGVAVDFESSLRVGITTLIKGTRDQS